MKNAYVVTWVSPRGFANEGEYLYGPITAVVQDEVYQEAKRRREQTGNGIITTLSYHKTLDNARFRAEKELRIARRREGWGEQSYDGAREVQS